MPNMPIQQISTMRQQGMSDNQIIQGLQRDGYKTHQIFDAMNQADLSSGAPLPLDDMPQQPNMQQPYPPNPTQNMPQFAMPDSQSMQPPSSPPFLSPNPQQYPDQYPPYPPQTTEQVPPDQPSYEKIEEIAESIIEEKWIELSKGISKIIEWKEKTDLKINELDIRIAQLKQSFDGLTKSLLGKMAEYDRNIGSVGSEIQAMEKVFQQMLPSFTENVNELSRITKNLKAKKD